MPNPALRAYLLQVGPPVTTLSTLLTPGVGYISTPTFSNLYWEVQVRGLVTGLAAGLTAIRAINDVPQEAAAYHTMLLEALNDMEIALERANGALDRQDKFLLAEAHISIQRYLAQGRTRRDLLFTLIDLAQR
ncbi:MAG TPA: hypothetical protein VFS21_01100 [Roseiflexaceae bacterium]|nr:hypothetical protein [Roseiflexaceae bacterium]